MRYHNITKDSVLNGEGLRVVLWVAGCSHYCKGCQNPITHDPKGGLEFDLKAILELFKALAKPYIKGLTLSGGDPLHPDNREEVSKLCAIIKGIYGDEKDIWVYTGYTYEQVKDLEVMKYIDVLVDGPFIEELKDNNLEWVGSSNQRVLRLKGGRVDV